MRLVYMEILGVLKHYKRKGISIDYLAHSIGIGRGEMETCIQNLINQKAVSRKNDVIFIKENNK
jgi:hypothetical protein